MKHAKSHTYHEHRLGYAIVRKGGGGVGVGVVGEEIDQPVKIFTCEADLIYRQAGNICMIP